MNAEGSPIQLCQQGHSYSSVGSRNDTDITERIRTTPHQDNYTPCRVLVLMSRLLVGIGHGGDWGTKA